MAAKSKAQQNFFAIAEHHPEKLRGPMPQMTHAQLHDYAATPTKSLPAHVPATPRLSTLAGVPATRPHTPTTRPNNLGHFLHPRKAR